MEDYIVAVPFRFNYHVPDYSQPVSVVKPVPSETLAAVKGLLKVKILRVRQYDTVIFKNEFHCVSSFGSIF
jgi:hypothetical protein